VGATHVRFLFGFPFGLLFLAAVLIATGVPLPRPPAVYWAWVLDGALTQIAATALMLAAMSDRSFVVVYAYIKTEPVQIALFGLVILGDAVTPAMAVAILIATAGVVIMALKPGTTMGLRATLLGLAAGAMFAVSAIGFRGAILSLALPSYLMAATFTLVMGLPDPIGAAVSLSRPARPRGTRAPSCAPGDRRAAGRLLGALASRVLVLAFALATAASVRTLALVRGAVFAQAMSSLFFKQKTSPREAVGIVLIVAGVAILLVAQ
jgi:drug/metabolite transporter (DMT)-like permease